LDLSLLQTTYDTLFHAFNYKFFLLSLCFFRYLDTNWPYFIKFISFWYFLTSWPRIKTWLPCVKSDTSAIHFLWCFTTLSVARQYTRRLEWRDDGSMMNWRDCARIRSWQCTISAWSKWGKPRNTSTRITDIPVESLMECIRIKVKRHNATWNHLEPLGTTLYSVVLTTTCWNAVTSDGKFLSDVSKLMFSYCLTQIIKPFLSILVWKNSAYWCIVRWNLVTFRRKILPPSSGSESKRKRNQQESDSKGSFCLVYSSVLNMEAVDFHLTTQRLSTKRDRFATSSVHNFLREMFMHPWSLNLWSICSQLHSCAEL
jgi:hypothetical protein